MRIPQLYFLGLIFLVCFFPSKGQAKVIHVPDDQSTIQDGIDAATEGDTVLVGEGIYRGDRNKNLSFGGKSIVLESDEGPEKTTIDCEGNGRGIFETMGNDAKWVISGFTIKNGDAGSADGGGIFFENCSPTIKNCIVVDNKARSGGGICFHTSSDSPNVSLPIILNCRIQGNLSDMRGVVGLGGGGIYSSGSSPYIKNCIISDNTVYTNDLSDGNGGGIAWFSPGLPYVPTVISCIISKNKIIVEGPAGARGGGIYGDNSFSTEKNQAIITNCVISENSINCGPNAISGFGAGIHLIYAEAKITNCTIVNNWSTNCRGGIWDCYNGGGVDCNWSSPLIKNSVLWGNSDSQICVSEFQGQPTGTPIVTYSDIQNGYLGIGNIDADPEFVSDTDYHLRKSSPCIDIGNSDDAPGDDIEGDARPQGEGYDMGAYESEYSKKLKAMPWIPLLLRD